MDQEPFDQNDALTDALQELHNVTPSDEARDRMWAQVMATQSESLTVTQADRSTLGSSEHDVSEVIMTMQQANRTLRRVSMTMAAVNIVVITFVAALVIAVLNREVPPPQVIVASPNTAATVNATNAGLVDSVQGNPIVTGSWDTLQNTAFRPVVMAVQPMPPGTHITADMLTVMMWPADVPLPGPVFSDVETVVGMYVRGHTSQFEPILGFNMSETGPPIPPPEDLLTEGGDSPQI